MVDVQQETPASRTLYQDKEFAEAAYKQYDQWKGWDRQSFAKLDPLSESTFAAELRHLPFTLPERASVLEIGFGQGLFLAYARKRCWSIMGVEINAILVDHAKSSGFICAHYDELQDVRNETFDLIVAFDVLEHIPQGEIMAFLRNVRRLLKPDGCFIARFPNGDSPFSLPLQNGDATHVNYFGSDKIRFFVQALNFDVVYVGRSALPIFNVGLARMLHRSITYPIKRFLNLLLNLIFYPKGQFELVSPNMTVVLKKPA